jgi:hypothetical protein
MKKFIRQVGENKYRMGHKLDTIETLICCGLFILFLILVLL